MSDEQRRKATARAFARVYEKRGLLKRLPCEVCGLDEAERHHEDYSKPLVVKWLCRKCHLAEHAMLARNKALTAPPPKP
jgi:hypothetical protein